MDSTREFPHHNFRIVIMASGFSRRFERENKLLSLFRGEPLCVPVMRAVAGCCEVLPDSTIGLVVSSSEAICSLASEQGLICLDNRMAHVGQSESIRIGLNHPISWSIQGDEYAVFIPADQPLLTAFDLGYFLDMVSNGSSGLWRSFANGSFGSPTAFHRRYYDHLRQLQGDSGGRKIFESFAHDTEKVSMRSEALEDIDTVLDLERLQARFSKG